VIGKLSRARPEHNRLQLRAASSPFVRHDGGSDLIRQRLTLGGKTAKK
jgi:hypothetical protein